MSYRFRRANERNNGRLRVLLDKYDPKFFAEVRRLQFARNQSEYEDDIIFEKLLTIYKSRQVDYNVHKILAFKDYIKPGMKILDFGGGNGQIAKFTKDKFNVDVTVADTVIPKKRENGISYVELKEHDKLPFADQSFDAICCFMVLHHIKERQTIIAELKRVTKTYIFIQEHDAKADDFDIIDLQHGLFMYVLQIDDYDKTKKFRDWSAYYFDFAQLSKYFNNVKLLRRSNDQTTKNYFALYEK